MIWLIDDDPDELFLITRTLRKLREGLVIETFASGEEALAYLTKCPVSEYPALIVSDLNMPQIDGPELFVRIAQFFQSVGKPSPQLVLVSSAMPMDVLNRTSEIRRLVIPMQKPDRPQDLAQQLVDML